MFSLRRLAAIVLKELRHITRDFRIFFLVTISPAFLLLVLAYVFAWDVSNINLAWLDSDRTPASRAYLADMTADGTFRLAETPESYEQIEESLLAGRTDVAVVVPPGFAADLDRWRPGVGASRPAAVQAFADGSDALWAVQALSGLAARTAAFGARQAQTLPLIQTRTRVWYNSGLKSLWGMVPGLLAVVLTLPALALTLAVAREQEVGTFEGLAGSPLRGVEYLLGKLLAYLASGLVSAALAVAVAVFWFRVPFQGSFWLFTLLSADFFLACMGVSLLIARFVTSQQTAMFLVLLIFFVPGFFISGLIIPVNTSSTPALVTSYALPATHFVTIARGIFLKGAGLQSLAWHAGILAAIGLGSLITSLLLFRKRVG